mmetsp:Transcript_16039/g.24037  ORF Transcript_16039/g.24037 Transcript_16039/m.24037 type:complete len:207 (+) Transcript_16039:3-623(+)
MIKQDRRIIISTKSAVQISSFIQIANSEHDALSDFCNSFTEMSYAMNQPKDSSKTSSTSVGMKDSESTLLDSSRFLFMKGNAKIDSSLMEYVKALKRLQLCHSELVKFIEVDVGQSKSSAQSEEERPRNAEDFISRHVQLSSRVLRTCASSSTSKGYGPLHENGLLKNLIGMSVNGSVDKHELRIVSLVSLRASIERIKIWALDME